MAMIGHQERNHSNPQYIGVRPPPARLGPTREFLQITRINQHRPESSVTALPGIKKEAANTKPSFFLIPTKAPFIQEGKKDKDRK